MIEAIFQIDSMASVEAVAQHFGKWDSELGLVCYTGFCVQGPPPSKHYFCVEPQTARVPTGNMIDGLDDDGNPIQYPEYKALPGKWGRLRIMAESCDFIDQAKAFAAANDIELTVYQYNATLGAWTSDGVTPAPDYVENIALIA
jgi:hypothetical protein